MKYRLVRAMSIEELEAEVNRALADGWELMNTPLVVATPTAVVWYLREMYKIETSTNSPYENLTFQELERFMSMSHTSVN